MTAEEIRKKMKELFEWYVYYSDIKNRLAVRAVLDYFRFLSLELNSIYRGIIRN